MKKLLMIGFCLMMVGAASISVVSARLADAGEYTVLRDPHENHANGNVTCWNITGTCADNDDTIESVE